MVTASLVIAGRMRGCHEVPSRLCYLVLVLRGTGAVASRDIPWVRGHPHYSLRSAHLRPTIPSPLLSPQPSPASPRPLTSPQPLPSPPQALHSPQPLHSPTQPLTSPQPLPGTPQALHSPGPCWPHNHCHWTECEQMSSQPPTTGSHGRPWPGMDLGLGPYVSAREGRPSLYPRVARVTAVASLAPLSALNTSCLGAGLGPW